MNCLKKVACICVIVSSIIQYPLYAENSGSRYIHDKNKPHTGFFCAMNSGMNYGMISGVQQSNNHLAKASFSGLANQFILDIGIAVFENCIIFGEFYGFSIAGPTLHINDSTVHFDKTILLSQSGPGFGVRYYFMPYNIYVSTAVTRDYLILSDQENQTASTRTENGYGIISRIGKEWFVTKQWGLGCSAFYYFSKKTDNSLLNVSTPIQGNFFGLSLSVTLN